jgi:hypothetical protein
MLPMKFLKTVSFILCFVGSALATIHSFSGNVKAAKPWLTTDTAYATATITIDTSISVTAFWLAPAGVVQNCATPETLTLSGNGVIYADSTTSAAKQYPTITCNGNGRIIVVATSGTQYAPYNNIIANGNDTTIFNKIITLGGVQIGNNNNLTLTGTSPIIAANVPTITLGTSALYTLSSIGNVNHNLLLSGNAVQSVSGIVNGSSVFAMNLAAAGITGTIQPFTYTGSGKIYIGTATGVGAGAIWHIASPIKTSGDILLYDNGGVSLVDSFVNGVGIKCATFESGNNFGSGCDNYIYGSGIDTITSYAGTVLNGGASRSWFNTSIWYCSGNWTNGNDTTKDNGPTAYFTGASTITSAKQPFNSLNITATAGNIIGQADSLGTINNFIDSIGTYKTNGYALSIGGNLYRYCVGADSLELSTSVVYMQNANATWKRRAPAGKNGGTISAVVKALGNLYFDVDTNLTFSRVYLPANKKLTITAHRAIIPTGYTAGDLNNDTLQSDTATKLALLTLPANTALTGAWIKDIGATAKVFDTAGTGGKLAGSVDTGIVYDTVKTGTHYVAAGLRAGWTDSVAITKHGRTSGGSFAIDGGAGSTLTSQSLTSYVFSIPAVTRGSHTITINNGNNVLTSISNLTALASVGIDSVRPVTGTMNGGTAITIYDHTGGFYATCTGSLGGSALTGVSITSPTVLTAVTPAHAAGAVTASVTNGDAQTGTLASAFTYLSAIAVTSIVPDSFDVAGGKIAINGSGFGATRGNGYVKFGQTQTEASAYSFWSATICTVTVPSGFARGSQKVYVSDNDGDIDSSQTFYTTYTPASLAHTLTAGGTAGGEKDTITGNNFYAAQGTGSVTYGANTATINSWAAGKICVTVPAHAAGAVTITVTNDDQKAATIVSGYTYHAFSLVGIAPAGGDTAGGTAWTVTGWMMGASRGVGFVYFGADTASSITSWSATAVKGTTKKHAIGTVNVSLRDNGGDSTALLNSWTFAPAPQNNRRGAYSKPTYRFSAYRGDIFSKATWK